MIPTGDPFAVVANGPGTLGLAAVWIEGAMTGSVATAVAIVAVASLGFGMMSGRIDVRRAAAAIAGCFILFGAGDIADGLLVLAAGSPAQQPVLVTVAEPTLPPDYRSRPAPLQVFDPYAGAALPVQ